MSHGSSPAPSDTLQSRLSIEIHGAVQGVGFRPYVYRLANDFELRGWVINDARGVFIEVEGPRERVEGFLERLPREVPPRALLQSIETAWLCPIGYQGFEIRHSADGGAKTALILPDIATCDDCLCEVLDPADHRHGYPFTNCTNCGPRFTIIQALPYDRPNTTMRGFTMCPECRREYEEPRDRRFHAQPNACAVCGPQLRYVNREGVNATDEALKLAAAAIREGKIVAVKGLGGFHLMCDARSDVAVGRLRERKPRRERPFALMAPDLDWVKTHCEVPPDAEKLLASAEAPIVLLRRKAEVRLGAVCPCIAPDNPSLGVMLPYTPLHHLLMRELGFPVVATSGNLSDEPICIDEEEAAARLGHIADGFLVHNRPIQRHADDSIAWIVAGAPRLLRRARGYAPLPVLLKGEIPPILAVGPHLKNTVSLSVGRQVFISQHIGDLETPEALAAFERVIADFLRLYEVTPAAIAHDLHPNYASTLWAQTLPTQERSEKLIAVQHHHAHLAACLAENQVEGPALGVIWDGAGYGTDGTVWGGEFLLGDASGYRRIAHLRPFRLPGADAAVHEPRRVALALLYELYGERAFEMDLPPVRTMRPADRPILAQMLARGLNAPLTTSMGRLFDGLAALIGLNQTVSFEGQAAMRLEFAADETERSAYRLNLEGDVLDWGEAAVAALADYARGAAASTISARFHNGLVAAIVEIARQCGQPRVALSGGCFQNRRLTERAADALRAAGFDVLLHKQTPPNDGCVSLGQVAVAAAELAR
ncbi:MAG: carbamoyltransferase HypF [Anaerolineae bacterium]|nr:carbamoyltransferase HypF [Anaerolineae bacterium]